MSGKQNEAGLEPAKWVVWMRGEFDAVVWATVCYVTDAGILTFRHEGRLLKAFAADQWLGVEMMDDPFKNPPAMPRATVDKT